MKPVIAITMGDPGGVGPEIILKSARVILAGKIFPLLIGSPKAFENTARTLRLKCPIRLVKTFNPNQFQSNAFNLFDISEHAVQIFRKIKPRFEESVPEIAIGRISPWNGALAYSALKMVADQASRGLVQGILTAPIHKTAVRFVDAKFIGHTEFLAKAAGVKQFAMMFLSPKLCVTLATIHVSIRNVSKSLSVRGIKEKIVLTDQFLKRYLKVKHPVIGVAALNPHGSEFGSEEDRLIRPAIRQAARKHVRVLGPFPGDEIFHKGYTGQINAIVAMYHDQGLAPFKMVSFHDGVNVTLGLPFLRTSPDHGTAFDIAYQNKANPASFQAAFRVLERALIS